MSVAGKDALEKAMKWKAVVKSWEENNIYSERKLMNNKKKNKEKVE